METPVLEGNLVRLEPLTEAHLPALEAIAFDPVIWRYMIYPMRDAADLRAWVDLALQQRDAGTALPWATFRRGVDGAADELVGATRFLDLDLRHKTVEIGNTWLTEPFRGTRVNSEAKLLQLTFAFETLDLQRVSFKTHIANKRSQAAVRAIGGVYEGTFRNHYIMADGTSRDSAWFSITRKEWGDVRDLLLRRLAAPL